MLQKDSSTLLVAGHQGIMLEVDLNRGKVTKEVHVRFLVIKYNTSVLYRLCNVNFYVASPFSG